MTTLTTRQFRIRGRVQGVGFRYAAQNEAKRLGLTGWVCNCPDFTVEASAYGDRASLDAFEHWLHQGPPGASVEHVESSCTDNEATSEQSHCQGFRILR